MALTKLVFKPGVNRDQSNYSAEGGWRESNNIRFREGYPEKIGGWQIQNFNQYDGTARALFTYSTSDGNNIVIVGTNERVYAFSGTTLVNITPIRETFTTTDTDNCFNTTDTSTTVVVNLTGHGGADGDWVIFSGAASVGGIPDTEINDTNGYQITVIDPNSFSFVAPTAATSTVSGGGGTAITAEFELSIGYAIATAGFGWGTSTWGRSTWGSGSTDPIFLSSRLIFIDSFNDDIIFNIRGDGIYYWVYNTSFTNRAVLLSSISGAIAVPQQVGKIMFAPSGHLFSFACTNYDATNTPSYLGSYDPLLIRWANVNADIGPEPEVWQPTATNNAGFLRIKSGDQIITAFPARQETLVWTNYSLSSIQFLGTAEVFSLQELSTEVNIMGPNVVASANNNVYWMGVDKFYVYSGRVDTLPTTLKQYIFEDINRNQRQSFFAGTNKEFNEIIWFYCSGNSDVIDRYVIYNYKENIWYYGQLNRTAWTDSGAIPYPLAVSDGWVYQHEDGHDDGQPLGAEPLPINAYIRSNDVDIADGEQFMLTKRIIPDVNFVDSDLSNSVTGEALTPQVQMTIGVRNFPGASSKTTDVNGVTLERNVTTTATINTYTNQVFIRARGRQMNFEIASDGIGVQWQLGAPRVDSRPDGRRG